MGRIAIALIGAATTVACFAGAAQSAELITNRGASHVTLAVNAKGEALVTYRAGGQLRRVLVWGATNARLPTRNGKQVEFKRDFSGGWRTYHTTYWETFQDRCAPYNGPALPDVVAACRAPDGSYWVAQAWQRLMPDLGYLPWLPVQRAKWLELSHWSGPVAQLDIGMNWVYDGKWQQIFTRTTYLGHPVYGFGTTRAGVPTDSFGQLVYIDTFNSTYGPGWRRENASVAHNPTGLFCYGLFPHDPTRGGYRHPPNQTTPRGPGIGNRYRIIAAGPGVTPNIEKVIAGLHDYDPGNPADVARQQKQNATLESWGGKRNPGGCLAGWFDA
ncbi:MAG: hypothetical protein H0W87_00385 [Actinobacteria bacterium]|nr:hypothetical protein [Actinomycetota bacterium]